MITRGRFRGVVLWFRVARVKDAKDLRYVVPLEGGAKMGGRRVKGDGKKPAVEPRYWSSTGGTNVKTYDRRAAQVPSGRNDRVGVVARQQPPPIGPMMPLSLAIQGVPGGRPAAEPKT